MLLLKKAKNHEAIVTLANALLLGHIFRKLTFFEGRRMCLAISRTLPSELMVPVFSRMRAINELFDVLDLSDTLAPEISKVYNSLDQCLSDHSSEKYHWIVSVLQQDAEIAKVCLDGFPFLKAQTDWNDLGKILEKANPDELQTPVARLQPTEVTQAAELLIITHFRILLTDAIGLDHAEAQQIGWDGVRDRLSVLRSQNPTRKAGVAAHKRSDEKPWLEEIKAKANRLLLDSLINKFSSQVRNDDAIVMCKYAMSLWPFDEREKPLFFTHLGELGAELCDQAGYGQQELEYHFPPDDELRRNNLFNVKADADPAEFLHFAQEQIGWLALQKGWALCIAEDLRSGGDSTLSRVSPDTFSPLYASARIAKPSDLGLHRYGALNEKARRLVGADRLWFVLAHELVELQVSERPASGPRSVSKIQREKAAQKVVNQLHAINPDARMVREDACIALTACDFSMKAAGRIWDNAAPASWKISGKPAYEMKRLSSDDLLEALEQAGV